MITINYSPSSIEDFRAAIEVLRENQLLTSAVVRQPKAITGNDPVSKYCRIKGQKRYMRTDEGCAAKLTPEEDLRLRADAGEPEAVAAFEGDPLDIPDTQDETTEQIPADYKPY